MVHRLLSQGASLVTWCAAMFLLCNLWCGLTFAQDNPIRFAPCPWKIESPWSFSFVR